MTAGPQDRRIARHYLSFSRDFGYFPAMVFLFLSCHSRKGRYQSVSFKHSPGISILTLLFLVHFFLNFTTNRSLYTKQLIKSIVFANQQAGMLFNKNLINGVGYTACGARPFQLSSSGLHCTLSTTPLAQTHPYTPETPLGAGSPGRGISLHKTS